MLLLSDGANSTGSEPLTVLDEAKEAGVPIYTIALGTASGTVDITNDYGQTADLQRPSRPRDAEDDRGGDRRALLRGADRGRPRAVYEEIGSQVSYEDEERELTAAFAAPAPCSC